MCSPRDPAAPGQACPGLGDLVWLVFHFRYGHGTRHRYNYDKVPGRRGGKAAREHDVGKGLSPAGDLGGVPSGVHDLRPVFIVPQRFSSDALRESVFVLLHMVGHEQGMVKLQIRVIAAGLSPFGISFVGDGKVQAEEARVMDLLIDAEVSPPRAQATRRIFV